MPIKQYRYAICKLPPLSMALGITTQSEKVDALLAREQHANYIATLRELGVEVIVLEADESLPDSHFVEDAAIIHKRVAIMTRPGALSRRKEVDALKPVLQKWFEVLELGGGGEEDALLDGGDILFAGNHVFIGLSHRTNEAGAVQLAGLLREVDTTLLVQFVPFEGVLHLKSGITALTKSLLIGNPAMCLPTPLLAGKIEWLSAREGYAANTLTINGSTMYFQECPSVASVIAGAGFCPVPMNMSEFRKMDGSFTCLSLLW